MIVGIGIDLVEIERVAGLLERSGTAFVDRVLHEDEDRSRLERNEGPSHFAGLFAAKEAVMKALGTGMAGAAFKDIRIRHTDGGQPTVDLTGATRERADEQGITAWHVSITHSKTSAAAVAIATSTTVAC